MGRKEAAKKLKEFIEMLEAVLESDCVCEGKCEEEAAVEENGEETYTEESLQGMSLKQLYDVCVSNGLVVPKQGKTKTFYIDKLKTLGLVVATDTAEEEPEEDASEYEGKTPMELYRMCISRGLKVEKKKLEEYYINALVKSDKEEADNDEWGDAEEEAPAPTKPVKGKKKQPEEDWNI